MKKKNVFTLLIALLLSLILISCDENNNSNNNPDSNKDNTNEPTKEPEVEIIKSLDSFEMYEEDTKEINLENYLSYKGDKYSYVISTEDKGVVSFELSGKTLKIKALIGGSENVTVKLNNKTVIFTILVREKIKYATFDDLDVTYCIDDNNTYEVELNPENANGYTEFNYSLKEEYDFVTLTDNVLTLSYKSIVSTTIVVTVSYGNNLKDEFSVIVETTTNVIYDVLNGSFDNGLEGWVLDGEFGVISNSSTWWTEGMPIFNEGTYFSGYGEGNVSYEAGTGTLTSSVFTLGGSGYITFMLGGSGNENCYVKVIDTLGNLLAIYRNTKFNNFPDGFVLGENIEEGKAMVGESVFLANFVKYKADLSDHIGKELQVVVCDDATNGWGLMFFDELKTYNTTDLEGYELAVNQLADYTQVQELLDNCVTEQGDYTLETFETYLNTINTVKNAIANKTLKQSVIDSYYERIITDFNNLKVREVIVKDATTTLKVISGDSLKINIADYFDVNNLSSITYLIETENLYSQQDLLVSFNTSGLTCDSFDVTLKVLYKNEVKKEVVITINILEDSRPVLKEEVLEADVDLYYENQSRFNLSTNIENVANLAIDYYILENEEWVKLEDEFYDVLTIGKLEEKVKCVYTILENEESIEYLLKLNVVDSTKNRLVNGDFETGDLTGWNLVGPMGDVSEETHYWKNDSESLEGYSFGKEGNYMFNAYAVDKEYAYGSLSSSSFVVGGTGWITFKIGAAKNTNRTNIQIIEKDTGNILLTFGNELWSDRTNDKKSGCTLIAYKADISSLLGKEVYIRVVDNAINDYGLFFVDSFVTYYTSEPENFNVAHELGIRGNIYEVKNGGFETGDLTGWSWIENYLIHDNGHRENLDINNPKTTFGKVSNLEGYWASNVPYNKDGQFLFTGLEGNSPETDPNLEFYRGILRSDVFVLEENSLMTFKLGGAKNTSTGIRVINAATGEVMASFYNTEFGKDGKEGFMFQYEYQFDNNEKVECYIEIFDNAPGDWGLVAVDSILCNTTTIKDAVKAQNQIVK